MNSKIKRWFGGVSIIAILVMFIACQASPESKMPVNAVSDTTVVSERFMDSTYTNE